MGCLSLAEGWRFDGAKEWLKNVGKLRAWQARSEDAMSGRRWDLLAVAVGGGVETEVVGDVVAEIGGRGETQHIGYSDKRQGLVAQETRNLQRRITVNPKIGGIAAYFLGDFGQVLGGYTELVGIPRNLAVRAELAVLQERQKAVHNRSVLRGDVVLPVERSMEIEELQDKRLHRANEHFAIEMVLGVGKAYAEHLKIVVAAVVLLFRKVHNGVEKQRQLPLCTIVGLRGTEIDKSRCGIDNHNTELLIGLYLVHQFAFAHDEQVPFGHSLFFTIEDKAATAADTEGVPEIVFILGGAESAESVGDDDGVHKAARWWFTR